MVDTNISPKSALLGPWRLVIRAGAPLFAVMFGFNAFILLVGMPVLNWIFEEGLKSAGMVTLDIQTIRWGPNLLLTGLILLLLFLVAAWIVALELAFVTLAMWQAQKYGHLKLRALGGPLKSAWKRLWHPSSFALLAYLLILLPLLGAGFLSPLESGIAIPPFITGELMKTPALAWTIRIIHLVALFVAIRLSLAVSLFVRSDISGWEAIKESWHLTAKWRWLAVLGGLLLIAIQGGLAGLIGLGVLMLPTVISDAITPGASVVVAALSVGFAEVLSLLIAATATALVAAWLLTATEHYSHQDIPLATDAGAVRHPKETWILTGVGVAVAIVLGITWIPVMRAMQEHPTSLVISHRGWVDGGVENTIGALEAAKEVGTDIVEMDVMQTKDGKFVVMHDPNLKRLSGQDVNVKDLTQAELMEITVKDEHGHTDKIPSLEEYVTKAQELDMPLLLEIKMGGLDSDDHVELFVAEMERLGALDKNIYHSLDDKSVRKLKRMRPSVTVGYIMPVAGEGVPDTPADFIVVEEESASPAFQSDVAATGRSFFVWTVNEKEPQREYLRRHIDAMITDHPDWALESREEMGEEKGMSAVLLDTMRSFTGL